MRLISSPEFVAADLIISDKADFSPNSEELRTFARNGGIMKRAGVLLGVL